MNLANFKNFDKDRMDLDDLVALYAFGTNLRAAYEKVGLDEPEFISVQLKALHRELQARSAASLEARKKEITNRIDSLKTPTQKKAELEKELRDLNRKLEPVA